MSSFTGYFNDAGAAGQAGYGLYRQIDRALNGKQNRCHFVRNNIVEVEFDVLLQESHSFQTAPTEFPVDRGSSVSDHIFTAPIELSLTGLVCDHPAEDSAELLTQTITSVGAGLAAKAGFGSPGVLAATVGYTSLAASGTSQSRSASIFNKIQALAGVTVPGAKPVRPATFDVVTKKDGKQFRRYPDMCIKAMQVQRDNTTGPTSLVFSLTLAQIRWAYAKYIVVRTAIPTKAAAKTHHGEAEEEQFDQTSESFKAGENSRVSQGARSVFKAIRRVGTGVNE